MIESNILATVHTAAERSSHRYITGSRTGNIDVAAFKAMHARVNWSITVYTPNHTPLTDASVREIHAPPLVPLRSGETASHDFGWRA